MLQAIRDHTSGWIAGFIVALLAIPFALWGINNYFVAQVEDWVAKVNDEEITQADYQQRLGNYRQRMRAMMGEAFDPEMFEEPGFRRQFLEDMIRQRVLLQATRDAGFTVPARSVAREIAGYEAFQSDGEFSTSRYQQILQRIGMTPSQFEQQVREDLLARQFLEALQRSELVPELALDDLIRLRLQTRTFSYLLFPTEDVRDGISVDEEEIRAYYEEHSEEFMTEEMVAIEYVELDAADLAREISVDEGELRAWFEEHRFQYLTNEQRLASHILVDVPEDAEEEAVEAARERALAAAERVRGGEDFAAVAQEVSDDPGSANAGGDLGWIEPDQMPTPFEEALFELEVGEVSDPVRTGFGFHVIELRDVQEPRGQSFEQARDQVERDYTASDAERRFLEQADRLVDLTYENPSNLEPAAQALDLEIKRAGPFTRNGGEDFAADPAVVETAFSDLVLKDRVNSDPVDLGPNHVAVVRVSEHHPSELRPLAEVSEGIRARLLEEKTRAATEQRAREALERLRAGEADLDALAAETEREMVHANDAGRDTGEHPAPLLDEVFRLPAPGEEPGYHAVPADGGDHAVVALVGVKPGDPAAVTQAEREQLRRQLAQVYLSAEISSMVERLKAQASVRVAEDRL